MSQAEQISKGCSKIFPRESLQICIQVKSTVALTRVREEKRNWQQDEGGLETPSNAALYLWRFARSVRKVSALATNSMRFDEGMTRWSGSHNLEYMKPHP